MREGRKRARNTPPSTNKKTKQNKPLHSTWNLRHQRRPQIKKRQIRSNTNIKRENNPQMSLLHLPILQFKFCFSLCWDSSFLGKEAASARSHSGLLFFLGGLDLVLVLVRKIEKEGGRGRGNLKILIEQLIWRALSSVINSIYWEKDNRK